MSLWLTFIRNLFFELSVIETFVEALLSSRFGVLPRADSSAAGTFDSVGRGIITAFTNGEVVTYCHFDSCVVPALGRPRRRWEGNIKMDLQEMGGGCGDWMELAQDRDRWRAVVGTVMNLRVP